jgi:hypothetical protein
MFYFTLGVVVGAVAAVLVPKVYAGAQKLIDLYRTWRAS